jgi:FixJ family two-component response regulator
MVPRALRAEHRGVTNTLGTVVAIIEDDDGMRRALQRILETEGYVTELHATAEEYLVGAAQTRARCMVLDLRLPGMSGVELMTRLRSQERGLPTILVTGFDLQVQWAELLGADCCLVKPFPPEILLQAVHRCLSRNSHVEDSDVL